MGRELERSGAPFRQPEWSALALMEAPAMVGRAHDAFVQAGADVITTNSYALVPFHLGEARFRARGRELASLAGSIARGSADRAARPIRVAGSLPPLFGSYRPDLFRADEARLLLEPLLGGLADHVDIWLGETLSSIAEARVLREVLAGDDRPLWLSFTLLDEPGSTPNLRSGESVTEAASTARELGAAAILFNCSQPEVMGPALRITEAVSRRPRPIGAYANAFPPMPADAEANAEITPLRADLDPAGYLRFAEAWLDTGAMIIGGCCGIGPEHIAALRSAIDRRHPMAR